MAEIGGCRGADVRYLTSRAFYLPPSNFDPQSQGFRKARAVISPWWSSAGWTRPTQVVCLSTVGVRTPSTNLCSQRT